jgi:hypothetical protein
MRGFALVVCSVLIAIGVGVGLVASDPLQPAARGAAAFARQVLAEASVPPRARPASKVVSAWLAGPLETPGVSDLIDLHRLYTLEEPPGPAESYILAHLPMGARVSSTGDSLGATGSAVGFVVLLQTSGPNEYLAQLAYDLAPLRDASETEMRVDAQTVWLPDRSTGELAPPAGIAEVTGFSQTGVAVAASGPVTVRLDSAQAKSLRAVLDGLALGPIPYCHENALLYEITFRPAQGSAPSFEADGWACGAMVVVTAHGGKVSRLFDAHCSLLNAVVNVLPANRARGTRSLSAGCHN